MVKVKPFYCFFENERNGRKNCENQKFIEKKIWNKDKHMALKRRREPAHFSYHHSINTKIYETEICHD